ncbi:hypothetical protein KR044_002241 [Drosophila immigrans]|nr:hypothetical protein KR044_002241 [Drosophila immigrans]
MTMFWRENAAQQHDPQQQQQQQQQPKRLSFSFNVKIAVNVNTKMSTTHINPNPNPNRNCSRSRSRSRSRSTTTTTTTQLVGWRQQLSHFGRQLADRSSSHGSGISTILIVNLLLLLLLSLCCDVCCRSHASEQQQQQQPLNYSSASEAPQLLPPPLAPMLPLHIQQNMRPTLDSDVVEKVAVWNKHVGAVAEGIAISSVARSRPIYLPPAPQQQQQQQQQQQPQQQQPQQQQQHELGLELDAGSDERIAIEQVTRDCVQRCIVEEDLFLDEFGIKCEKADNSDKCYKTRCTNGCAQWYRALKEIEPCQEACASTQFYPFDMPCIGACQMAQREYWHLQRVAMTQLVETTQPQLVEMGGESSTLTIRWDMQFSDNYLASRPFNIQYQQQPQENQVKEAEEDEPSWHNLADYNCDEYYVCEIPEALMPYTRYKFRFELPFGESSDDVLYSPATITYQTPMAGAPISAPIFTTLLALDEHHVAIHWRPGRYTNAPLQGYHIRLSSLATSNASSYSREELLPASRGSFIFGELQPLTNYAVELTMINKQGKGPSAMASIETKAPLPSEQLHSVLLASEHSISWQSLESAGESRLIYSSSSDPGTTISDIVFFEQQQKLWLLNSQGQLIRKQLEDGSAERELLSLELNLEGGAWLPRRLTLDWLQQRLYLAAQDAAHHFHLFSCNLDGGDVQQVVDGSLGDNVQQLELDAINGWLFWRDAQTMWRLDVQSKQRLQLHQAQELRHFVLLPQRWLLQLLQGDDLLIELSYDGSHKRQLEQLNNCQTFALSSDRRQLLLANATQLQLLHEQAAWPLNAAAFRLLPLERRCQPAALAATMPSELQALLGSQAAQITWQAPALNPYQSPAAATAHNCSYELEVLDVASQSAYNIRNIRSPHFGLERLQPDNLYQLRVRAVNAAGQPSAWTAACHARSWPRGVHRLRWATERGELYTTNELGAQLELLSAELQPAPFGLTPINESLAYYVSNATLHCINLQQPQLSCQAPTEAHHVGDLAYDWRGGLLYWSDLGRNCVQRLDPQRGSRELLPVFGARQLALDAAQGHLYYASGTHLARRPLSGQPAELEFHHGRVSAFCLDLQQRHIYWLVERRLHRAALSGSQALELLQLLPQAAAAVPHSLQFLQPLNALLWLSPQPHGAQLLRLTEADAVPQQLLPQGLQATLTAVQLTASPPVPDLGVRPLAVPPDTIRIDEGGHWTDFRLRWQPAASGGNHSISYKLLLQQQGSARLLTLELATPFARITHFSQAPAQSSLHVSLTPYTLWRAGPTTSVQLQTTPLAAAPTQPRRLRVFIERAAQPLQLAPNVSALLRWDVPENEEKAALQYRISCWQDSELHAELLLNQSTLEARIEQLQPDVTYRFQVQAQLVATGAAAGVTSQALHVTPAVQAVPRLLYANAEHIGQLDLDTTARQQLVHTASAVEHLALLQGEQRLLWVNEHVELLSHVPGTPPAKLARMRAEVLALTVDWVQRIVYWAELDASTQPPSAAIYRLDLCRFAGRILQGERLWRTPPGQLLHDLLVLPHARALLWMQRQASGARNSTLQGRSLVDGSALHFEGLPGPPLWRLFEGSQEPLAETLNLVDQQGELCVYHVARQLCMPTALRAQLNMLIDDIAQLAQDAGYIYALRNGSVRAYSRRRQQLAYVLELQADEVRLLRAYNYQAYPARRCLLLPPTLGAIEAPTCSETHCQLRLPALTAAADCALPVPGLEYQLQLSADQAPLRQLNAVAGELLNITALQPYRAYELRVRISSYYQQQLDMEPLQLAPLTLQTAAATPSAPRNFTARALSPSELEVSWLAPQQLRSDSVYYTLHWLLAEQSLEASEQEQRVELAGTQRLTALLPGGLYELWVQAHATPSKHNRTASLFVRCYAALPPLQLQALQPYGMTLSWPGTPDVLSSLTLECRSLHDQLQLTVLGNHTLMQLAGLQPKTRYACHLALNYAASPGAGVYRTATQHYETLGDAPSAPGQPQIEHIAGEVFRVSWSPALEHGEPIVLYNMEALQARRSSRRRRRRRRDTSVQLLPWAEEPSVLEDQWLDFCNTTELSCIVRELHTQRLVLFRVRARNRPHGWGPYSEESVRIAEPFVSPEKRGSLVLAIIAPAAIVSSCVLALFLVRKVQKRRHRAKKLLQQSRPSIWSNLSTLQTQQQLLAARNRTFSMTLSDADIALLPQISWSRLTLLRFLGSGAFGEVYEGQLQGEDEAQPQRVAIKSLRKGASEFAELLQEAQLMSNFKHENIVCLIGICFDSESISLIMEHMEAGDLLSYLRAARGNNSQEATLQLSDLLSMCLDVANGCSYLEDMHFVHRDLACRNCLVSNGAAVGGRRIVKIGDFGLARDIYKSDYYRKEGEGLLPVRWMALESLVDGIFSTQSDVWAFGVLCWEILTLGQQPYAARNNFEVLAHVKDGGRLQPPDECPEKLYSLLLQCWRCEPWERPSFRRCYNTLQSISSEPSSSAKNPASKPEIPRVRFDEETPQDTKDATDNRKLYANEGVSRL